MRHKKKINTMRKNKNLYKPLNKKVRKKIDSLLEGHYEQAALGTVGLDGFPLVTKIVPMLKNDGVFLLLSDLSEHTKNISQNNKVSIYFAKKETHKIKSNNSRLSLQGTISKLNLQKNDTTFLDLVNAYKKIEFGSDLWASFTDFNFYQFFSKRTLYVEGFASAYEEIYR